MFEVEVTAQLKFTHYLEGFDKEISTPHEHIWFVTVTAATASLDRRGISIDFLGFRDTLTEVLAPCQDKLLNDLAPFDKNPPTAENIARMVAGKMSSSYPDLVKTVTVGSAQERARYILP